MFELTIDMVMNRDWVSDAVVAKVIVNSIIGVLWEGVTHEDSQVRILTVRSLTCATKLLTIEEISTQLFPPINSLVNDENSLVRSETAKTIAILQQRLQSDENNQQPQQQLPLGHPSIRQPTPSLPQHHLRPTLATNVTNLDTTRATVPTIDKSKKIAWFETQLRNDQKEATQPNYKTPFRSREDTCKRLLRYHVYNEETMDQQDLIRADLEFEKKAETLLERYQVNLSKYHLLLLDESTRLCSSACEAMLGRMWVAEEKSALAREKEEYRSRCNR